ncbi:unnamed protein product [Heterobilharzia americana]|nr:unnamed protein product [Heterobilharzia americana]
MKIQKSKEFEDLKRSYSFFSVNELHKVVYDDAYVNRLHCRVGSYPDVFCTHGSSHSVYSSKTKVPFGGESHNNDAAKHTPKITDEKNFRLCQYNRHPFSKSYEQLSAYQLNVNHRPLLFHKHKSSPDTDGSGFDVAFKSFSSHVSSSSSSKEMNQNEVSDDEELPGSRKRRNLSAFTDNSDESEQSVSFMHSCSDFNSYCSEAEENGGIKKDCTEALQNLLDGVVKLQLDEHEGVIALAPEGDASAADKDPANVDADEDKRNPAYIPRGGRYYMHDHRTLDEDIVVVKKRDNNLRWQHDKFNYNDQCPMSTKEIIWKYGYDIRKENSFLDSCETEASDRNSVASTHAIPGNRDVSYCSQSRPNDKAFTRSNNATHNRGCRNLTVSYSRQHRFGRFTRTGSYPAKNTYRDKNTHMEVSDPGSASKPLEMTSTTDHEVSDMRCVSSPKKISAKHMHFNDTQVPHFESLQENHQQDSDYSSCRITYSNVVQNKENVSKPSVIYPQRVNEKDVGNTKSLHTNDSSKPWIKLHTGHTQENVRPAERIPKRYSVVRQNVVTADSSSDKKPYPTHAAYPICTRESNYVGGSNNASTKLSGSEDFRIGVPHTQNSVKSQHEHPKSGSQVPSEVASNISTTHLKVQPGPVSFNLSPVPAAHYQSSLQYGTSVPVEYSALNTHLQTIYFSDVFQHDAHFQPLNAIMSNYVLANTHPQVPSAYTNEMDTVNYSVPVATNLCFEGVSCSSTSEF